MNELKRLSESQEKWLWIRGGRTPYDVIWNGNKPYIDMWYYKMPRLYKIPSPKKAQEAINKLGVEVFSDWCYNTSGNINRK